MEEKNKIDTVADEIKNSKTVRSLFTWIIALSLGFSSFFGVANFIRYFIGYKGLFLLIAATVVAIAVILLSLKFIDFRKK